MAVVTPTQTGSYIYAANTGVIPATDSWTAVSGKLNITQIVVNGNGTFTFTDAAGTTVLSISADGTYSEAVDVNTTIDGIDVTAAPANGTVTIFLR